MSTQTVKPAAIWWGWGTRMSDTVARLSCWAHKPAAFWQGWGTRMSDSVARVSCWAHKPAAFWRGWGRSGWSVCFSCWPGGSAGRQMSSIPPLKKIKPHQHSMRMWDGRVAGWKQRKSQARCLHSCGCLFNQKATATVDWCPPLFTVWSYNIILAFYIQTMSD